MSVNIFGASGDSKTVEKQPAGTEGSIDLQEIEQKIESLNTRKFDKNGGYITGNVSLQMTDLESIRTFGLSSLSRGQEFFMMLGDFSNAIYHKKGQPVEFKSDQGVKFNNDIIMNDCSIGSLREPIQLNECATKLYVDTVVALYTQSYFDRKIYAKNPTGLIPNLGSNNSKLGFVSSASVENVYAYKGFNEYYQHEWVVPENVYVDFWLQIKLPETIKIYKFAIRGKRGQTEILDWVLEGSNDGEHFDGLFLATNSTINTTTQFFHVNTKVGTESGYLYYRLFIKHTAAERFGISYFQVYSFDEVVSN